MTLNQPQAVAKCANIQTYHRELQVPKNGGYRLTCQCSGHWMKSYKGKDPEKFKRKGGGNNTANITTTSDATSKSIHVNSVIITSSNTTISDCNIWLADSATTSHIMGDKQMFFAYHEIDQTITGVVAAQVKAIGIGSVLITSEINGRTHSIRLHDICTSCPWYNQQSFFSWMMGRTRW